MTRSAKWIMQWIDFNEITLKLRHWWIIKRADETCWNKSWKTNVLKETDNAYLILLFSNLFSLRRLQSMETEICKRNELNRFTIYISTTVPFWKVITSLNVFHYLGIKSIAHKKDSSTCLFYTTVAQVKKSCKEKLVSKISDSICNLFPLSFPKITTFAEA